MFQLGDKTRIIFAIIGASCILVSMYLIPLIKTENKLKLRINFGKYFYLY